MTPGSLTSRGAVATTVTAAVAASALGAGLGWRCAPASADAATQIRTHLVLARVPTGPPVYVQPRCVAIAPRPTFQTPGSPDPRQPIAGRVPAGFVPIRAVRCQEDFHTDGFTVTQSETATPADLRAVLAALDPPRIEEPLGTPIACPAIGQVAVTIALVDAHGTAVSVDLPRDECGLYVDTAVRTLGTAHWTVTGTTQASLP